MPPLTLHAVIAKEVADDLRRKRLDEERGSLYLGATAPDIRIITRWERERTHFFSLGKLEEQSSVQALFEAHPTLSRASLLSPATVAFMTGYLTHLVMDEMWIKIVYRPFFGVGSPLGGDLRARIMDRAMQFALDRERRLDRELMGHLLKEVAKTDLDLNVGFLDEDVLQRWKEIMVEVINREPEWDQFRMIAGRHLREAGLDGPAAFEEFLRSVPQLIEDTIRYLTPERVQAFMEDAFRRALEHAKEYLDCA